MPPHNFDEVITSTECVDDILGGVKFSGGADYWRGLSDLVRLSSALDHQGWVYHDFDCRVLGLPSLDDRAWFARYGKYQIDYFLYYVGGTAVFEEMLDGILGRRKNGQLIFPIWTVHNYLNQYIKERVGVIEQEYFVHEGSH